MVAQQASAVQMGISNRRVGIIPGSQAAPHITAPCDGCARPGGGGGTGGSSLAFGVWLPPINLGTVPSLSLSCPTGW